MPCMYLGQPQAMNKLEALYDTALPHDYFFVTILINNSASSPIKPEIVSQSIIMVQVSFQLTAGIREHVHTSTGPLIML